MDLTGKGYDSDGTPPPFSSRFDKHYQEAAVNAYDVNEEIFDDSNDGSADNMFVQLENEEIKKFKVGELRAELTKRVLIKNGLKLALQEILYKAMDDGVACIKTSTAAATPTGFHKNARWHFIDSKDLPDLLDPVNETFETAYAPHTDKDLLVHGSLTIRRHGRGISLIISPRSLPRMPLVI